MADHPQPEPFVIKDCALLSIATGRRAQNLRELRDHLGAVEISSIYYHFWGRLLRPRLDDPEYNNDFAAWVAHGLRELAVAERLAVIDPAGFPDLEELRRDLLEVIDAYLDESDYVAWARRQDQFHFRRAQTVVFDTGRRIGQPTELATVLPTMSLGSIFYHFVDARRRPPQTLDDFRVWLGNSGERYAELIRRVATVDPYFVTLAELRETLGEIFRGVPLQ